MNMMIVVITNLCSIARVSLLLQDLDPVLDSAALGAEHLYSFIFGDDVSDVAEINR